MSRRILKWKLPVDDRWHLILGHVLHCETDDNADVLVWGWESDRKDTEFCVFGTGHEIPDGVRWVGTTRNDRTGLVWHVMARSVNT